MKKRNALKFNMPTKSDLKSRKSTISNAFAIAITPYLPPSDSELETYFNELEIRPKQCGYCLKDGNSVDHIKPLVRKGLPTGFVTNLHNLIPCCSSCNSKKGAKDFYDWYLSADNINRLHGLGLTDETIRRRYEIISSFIEKHNRKPLDYESIVGKEKWAEYIKRKEHLFEILKEDQLFCDGLKHIIEEHLKSENDA